MSKDQKTLERAYKPNQIPGTSEWKKNTLLLREALMNATHSSQDNVNYEPFKYNALQDNENRLLGLKVSVQHAGESVRFS